MTFHGGRLRRAALPVAAAILVGLLLAIAADVIRLGPTSVDLSDGAIVLTVDIVRVEDGDPSFDYYYGILSISNFVKDPRILPYEAAVRLRVDPGGNIRGHHPSAGDHASEEAIFFPDIERTFTFPAGRVTYDEPEENVAGWTVLGERLLQSAPIFEDRGDFVAEVRIPQGASITVTAEVTLTWYYRSFIQAYPVASRTTEAGLRLIASGRAST